MKTPLDRTLLLKVPLGGLDKVVAALDANLSNGWQRDRVAEELVRSLLPPDSRWLQLMFCCDQRGDRPAATLSLWRSGSLDQWGSRPGTLAYGGILSELLPNGKHSSLNRAKCDLILNDFIDNVVVPSGLDYAAAINFGDHIIARGSAYRPVVEGDYGQPRLG